MNLHLFKSFKKYFIGTVLVINLLHIPLFAQQSQSNLIIAPSPIPYPYFKPDLYDLNLGLSFTSITSKYFGIGLFDFNGKGRYAFNDFFALDSDFGFGFGFGSMTGFPPMTNFSSYGYYAWPEGDASIGMISMRWRPNMELQVFNTGDIGMIIFMGFNFNLTDMTINTPYYLINTNTGQTFYGFKDRLTITSVMSGYQFGIQFDLGLGQTVRFSPFIMITETSGSVTIKDDPGVKFGGDYPTTEYAADIPSTAAMSLGMDIYFDDISIGTLLQQLQSTQSTNQDVRMIQFSISYNWSNRAEKISEENKTEDTQEEIQTENPSKLSETNDDIKFE